MYGGDEVTGIVVDLGSHTIKAGFAGEDSPKCVLPSDVGFISETSVGSKEEDDNMDVDGNKEKYKYYIGTNSLWYRRDHMEIKNPFSKGLINDWDSIEQLLDNLFKSQLYIDPKENPLLISEPTFNTKVNREKLTELAFELFETPAFFISKSSVLSSFANGKSTSLVVDLGGSSTCITPIHDGYALQKCSSRSSLAGELLTEEYFKILTEQRNIIIRPHYMIESKKEVRPGQFEVKLRDIANKTTDSYKLYMIKNVVRDIKETVTRLADTHFDDSINNAVPTVSYELPDGTTIDLGTDRFKIPELLFDPDSLNKRKTFNEEFLPLHTMIYNTVAKCDPDIRRELFSSIIVTGGTSLFPQLSERLYRELSDKSPPQSYKVKLLATTTQAERRFSTWIGGSILASLGTFQQMWMTKQEYDEHGASLVERKCP